jgi:hypothetical protein
MADHPSTSLANPADGAAPDDNPFFEEWRACLRAHFEYVLRENDTINRDSLYEVLLAVGFSEAQLVAAAEQIVGPGALPPPKPTPPPQHTAPEGETEAEALSAPPVEPADEQAGPAEPAPLTQFSEQLTEPSEPPALPPKPPTGKPAGKAKSKNPKAETDEQMSLF